MELYILSDIDFVETATVPRHQVNLMLEQIQLDEICPDADSQSWQLWAHWTYCRSTLK